MIDWLEKSPTRGEFNYDEFDEPYDKNGNPKSFIPPVRVVHLECTAPQCDQKLGSEWQLLEHLKTVHKIYEYRCNASVHCLYSSIRVNKLLRHFAAAHPGKETWTCPHCGEDFIRWSDLNNHNHNFHAKGHFECSFRGCTFSGKCREVIIVHHREVHDNYVVKKDEANKDDIPRHFKLVHGN